MQEFKTFSSKILIFGEHIINKGSNGLATPFSVFNCKLSFDITTETLNASEEVLVLIFNQINNDENLSEIFDLVSFEQDIYNGLKININIPVGYGLGSSGAICAGVYDEYCYSKTENPHEIKRILGEMEGAFHGKSSGLDPLVSFLNKSVLVTKKTTEIVDFKIENNIEFHIFLVDTKQARKTAPLVNVFLEKYDSNESFARLVSQELVPLTNEIIDDFLSNSLEQTYSKIAKLSALQLKIFKEFILEKYLKLWKKALNNNDFYLKICGAGAGGFMLGFCKDKSCVLDVFDEDLIIFL